MLRSTQQLHSKKAILGDFVRKLTKDLTEARDEIRVINSAIESVNRDNQLDMLGEDTNV